MRPYERVYTVTDYYDGPRVGVADFNGTAHLYESEWSADPDNYVFRLSPVDQGTLELVLEDWQIWLRWERAYHDGTEPQETHPALPIDRARHEELKGLLSSRLLTALEPVCALATFRRDQTAPWDGLGNSAPLEVQWTPLPMQTKR
jgi:hypothetical protein